MRLSCCPIAAVLLTMVACNGVPTGGQSDGAVHDAGTDAGVDAGVDAGIKPDAGMVDAGPSSDAGIDAGEIDGGPLVAVAVAELNQIAQDMTNFHQDTGGWPIGNSAWYGGGADPADYPAPPWEIIDGGTWYMSQDLMPGQFTKQDTALVQDITDPPPVATTLSACATPVVQPCWSGPYATVDGKTPTSMFDVPDPWGNQLYYMYIQPYTNGNGGGDPDVPSGGIVIWSSGPDGIDETGCVCSYTGMCPPDTCLYNEDDPLMGVSSTAGSDDIITVVSTTPAELTTCQAAGGTCAASCTGNTTSYFSNLYSGCSGTELCCTPQ